jgi:protein-tyrosine-phosphatase
LAAGGDLPGAVLFACSKNAVRSPMAEALLKHLAGMRVYVASAGVRPGEPDPFAAAVMEELGIDISHHAPRALDALGDASFDLIVSLSPEAHHKARLRSPKATPSTSNIGRPRTPRSPKAAARRSSTPIAPCATG